MRARPWMVVSMMWLAPAALATLDRIVQRRLSGDPPPAAPELIWAGGDWLVYAFVTPIIFWLSRRWPIARPHLARRTALHLGIALLFCAAWAIGGTALRLALGLVFQRSDSDAFVRAAGDHFWRNLGIETLSWISITLPFGVVVYLAMPGTA